MVLSQASRSQPPGVNSGGLCAWRRRPADTAGKPDFHPISGVPVNSIHEV